MRGTSGELDDEMRLTVFELALQNGKCLSTERVMGGRDTDVFDVSGIQPRGMLVVVPSGTNAAA